MESIKIVMIPQVRILKTLRQPKFATELTEGRSVDQESHKREAKRRGDRLKRSQAWK